MRYKPRVDLVVVLAIPLYLIIMYGKLINNLFNSIMVIASHILQGQTEQYVNGTTSTMETMKEKVSVNDPMVP